MRADETIRGEKEIGHLKTDDIARAVRGQLGVGDPLFVHSMDGRKDKVTKCYIKAFYPCHILSVNEYGFTESFSYYDVYQMLHGVLLEERVDDRG